MAAAEDELLRMSVTGDPPASSAGIFDREKSLGNDCFGRGDYQSALGHYRAAGAADPSSPVPVSNAAMTLLRLDRPADALEAATTALELLAAHSNRPGSMQLTIKTLLRRSTARTELQQYTLAAHDLEEILLLQPGHEVASRALRELRANHMLERPSRGTTDRPAPVIEVMEDNQSPGQQASSTSPFSNRTLATSRPSRTNGHARSAPAVDVNSSYTPSGLLFEAAVPSRVLDAMTERLLSTSPRNYADFERTWRSLRTQPLADRGHYVIEAVGASRIQQGLLGESITSRLLIEIASALLAALEARTDLACSAFDILQALSAVPRFEMTVMFNSNEETLIFADLFRRMERTLGPTAELESLRSKYGCLA
jgi:hypothetical protein